MEKQHFLGLDLGGTAVKCGIVDDKGLIIEEKRFDHTDSTDPQLVAKEIIKNFKEMKNTAALKGTGIGVAGDIDQKKGIVRFSPNLRWHNINLKELLAKELPSPILVDNDANAAAWGAFWLEAKAKVKNLICITLGTGVGGGIICDGKLYRGATGTAGEIGHIPLEPNGLKCNCGCYGCIERYVGGPNLVEQARDGIKKGMGKGILAHAGGKPDRITPETLSKAAEDGDEFAISIWKLAGERLGIVISGLINVFNPEMIVFTGGISKAGDLLFKPITETIKRRAFKTPAEACKIVVSGYNHRLGVVGAALLSK